MLCFQAISLNKTDLVTGVINNQTQHQKIIIAQSIQQSRNLAILAIGSRGIKKPAPKAQGAQKKGKRREKRDYFNYIPIYLYLKVYQTVDKNEAVQFISFSLIREK